MKKLACLGIAACVVLATGCKGHDRPDVVGHWSVTADSLKTFLTPLFTQKGIDINSPDGQKFLADTQKSAALDFDQSTVRMRISADDKPTTCQWHRDDAHDTIIVDNCDDHDNSTNANMTWDADNHLVTVDKLVFQKQ